MHLLQVCHLGPTILYSVESVHCDQFDAMIAIIDLLDNKYFDLRLSFSVPISLQDIPSNLPFLTWR